METSRFFVTNLRSDTTEQDLSGLFQDYGEVTRVELKTKKNLVDEEDVQLLAFVTVNIGADDAHYCLNELNWQKLNGAKIKVSLAKESFLERLKREREEAEAAAAGVTRVASDDENASELLRGNLENTRKTFDVDEELDDDDVAPELMIRKKRPANSLQNGKIVIQNYDTTPIHIIETKKAVKHLEGKSLSADQKRKESMVKMKQQYQQQKSAIQLALAGMDASSAKKIKFSDAEEDDEEVTDNARKSTKSKTNIFDSDNGEEEDEDQTTNFKLKPELFGKKGEKLVQMQSKQSMDPRFKINAKFVDDEEEEEEVHADAETNGASTQNERDWQMGILEQVVGTKLDTATNLQKAAKNKKMLRYDPDNEEHQKYLRNDKKATTLEEPFSKKKLKAAGKQKQQDEENMQPSAAAPEVSKEVFYTVSDTLTQSLKTRGDGFSLLNMFGQAAQTEQREQQLQKVSNEKILVNKLDRNALNPFSHDSSDEEQELQNETQKKEEQSKTGKQKSKVPVTVESFFIPKNDARLKEGAKFFKYDKKEDTEQNYEEVRNRLKLLIKTKITKSRKQFTAAGGKMGKNKRH